MDFYFILGVIISILLAYWGIWQGNKSKTKPQLYLINQNTIPLISTFKENFETLDLSNYKLPFNANQYYYRGTIINSGNTDIYRNIILQPLKISFPNDFKIISYKLGQKTSELNIEIKQENQSIILQWDILKPLEHFTFELIIESIQNFPIYELPYKIKIDSRIADLDSIKKTNIGYLKGIKKNFFSESLPTYLFVVLLASTSFLILLLGIESFYTGTGKLDYSLVNKQSKNPVELEYYNTDSLILKENKDVKIIARKNLDNNVGLISKVTIIKNRYFLILLSALALVFFIFRIISMVRNDIRNVHLKRILVSLSK
ncbi:MAG: hypothetical protein ACTHOB_08560 [Ginsengibacter sp.]